MKFTVFLTLFFISFLRYYLFFPIIRILKFMHPSLFLSHVILIFSFLSWHKFLRKCKDHKCQTRNLGKTEVCSSSGHVLNESRSAESKSHSTLKEKFFLKKKKNCKRKVCISCNRHGTVFFFFFWCVNYYYYYFNAWKLVLRMLF